MNRPALPYLAAVAVLLAGCGGGSGGGTVLVGRVPTAKTKADVRSHLAAVGQGIIVNSLKGYGPAFQTHATFFDPLLGLWCTSRVSPSALNETFYLDQANTQAAGSLSYKTNDITFGESGNVSITAGLYKGLTGTYNQILQAQADGNSGLNGSIVFSIPSVSTVDCQFAVTLEGTGASFGSTTNAVALESGYTQNEKVTINTDGSLKMTVTDSNSVSDTLSFFADYSGTGKITGSDPGLPATFSWDDTGSGSVKFADGSTVAITRWQLAATS